MVLTVLMLLMMMLLSVVGINGHVAVALCTAFTACTPFGLVLLHLYVFANVQAHYLH